MTARLAVIILQYGNWQDTVACLQSLVSSVEAGLARVIVVDNASIDDSAAQVVRWIDGAHALGPPPPDDPLVEHWHPLAGCAGAQWQSVTADAATTPSAWTFVQSRVNRGFAAGMNVGLRIALADPSVDTLWLLNNDTVVAPGAVPAIVAAVDASPGTIGQFGTTVCHYDRPTVLQTIGWCRWNPWLATAERIGDGALTTARPRDTVQHPGYVYGASWVLRSDALRDVGLLSEEGFLYGEELDWSCRAASRWQTGLIEAAVVWHREGATIGARASTPRARSELADLCGISARLRLTRRFFPRQRPAVYSSLFGAVLNRLRQGDARRAAAVLRLVLAGGVPAPWPSSARAPHSSTES
jgi:GT2 family glycosyltransferase